VQVLSPAPMQASISSLEKMLRIPEQPEVLQWKPALERWSIQEVLAHLAVIEQLHNERVCRIVTEEDPALANYVAPCESEVQQKTPGQRLEHFIALRRAPVVFLHSVPATARRTGRHYGMGSISVWQLLHELANHDLGHSRQLTEFYRANALYPHAEPFQRFSHPKP